MKMTRLAAAVAASVMLAPVAHAKTMVEIAAGDARFTTLEAAVTATGLAGTLPGPFTVCAGQRRLCRAACGHGRDAA